MSAPILSVILPAYNAAPYICDAIDSILNQTFRDFELIIADDGSQDNTRAIIENYTDARIVLSHNTCNQGKTATVNRLIRFARGEFVTIHDADDVSHPQRFSKQVAALEEDIELLLCGSSFLTVDQNGYVLERNNMPATYEEVLNGIGTCSQFHGPTVVFRHSAVRNFSEVYRPYFRDNYEDTDLIYRVVEQGKSINLQEYLYVYRILDNSLCRRQVDVRNRNLYKVVAHLGAQRKEIGTDVLMQDRPELADEFLDQVTQHYKHDAALLSREAAAYYLYWKLNMKACRASAQAFLTRPFHPVNLRTFLYVIRKIIINKFKSHERHKEHYKESMC